MKVKGCCTSADLSTISFVLDGSVTVYATLLNNKVFKVPAVGDVLWIDNPTWFCRKDIYLTGDTVIHIETSLSLPLTSETPLPQPHSHVNVAEEHIYNSRLLTQITTKYEFVVSDLNYLNKIINRLKHANSFPLQENLNDQKFMKISVERIVLSSVDRFRNKVYSLKVPGDFLKDCRVARPVRPWQFFHLNTEFNEYLIGCLHVSPLNGFVQVTDRNNSVNVVILCEQPSQLSRRIQLIMGKYVMVTKYYVVKEEFRNVDTFPYIVVQANNIYALANACIPVMVAPTSQFANVHVRQRCSISLNQANKPSFLIYCYLKSVDREQSCFLRLEKAHLNKHPMFNDQDEFKLRCDQAFARRLKYTDKDMAYHIRTKYSIPCYILPSGTTLQYLGNKELESPVTWKSVSDVISELKVQNKMTLLSFEGVIQSKKLILNVGRDPINTRYRSKPFGLPRDEAGSYTYEIELIDVSDSIDENPYSKLTDEEKLAAYESHENSKEATSIRVVLSQWSHKQCPLGLLPCMRVRLHNWIPAPNNTNCLISTITSSITPVNYYQRAFNSANIKESDWGAPWLLSVGGHVPIATFCWGPIESIAIRTFLLEIKCDICFNLVDKGACRRCKPIINHSLTGKLVLLAKDIAGVSEVTTCETSVVQILLDLDDSDWIDIENALVDRKGRFFYNSFDDNKKFEWSGHTLFTVLTNYLKSIGLTPLRKFDLKCRKIVYNHNENSTKIKWYCIEARRTQI